MEQGTKELCSLSMTFELCLSRRSNLEKYFQIFKKIVFFLFRMNLHNFRILFDILFKNQELVEFTYSSWRENNNLNSIPISRKKNTLYL